MVNVAVCFGGLTRGSSKSIAAPAAGMPTARGPRHRRGTSGGANGVTQSVIHEALEHVPKKLLDFFDWNTLQLVEFERFLPDQMIPSDREAL